MVRAVAELAVRTAHSETFDAAELAFLDFEAALRNDGAYLGERGLHPGAGVGRAAHDLPRLARVRDLQHVEMVGVRVRGAFGHFHDHEVVGKRRGTYCLDGLYLKTGARQALREFARFDVVDFYVFVQPAKR